MGSERVPLEGPGHRLMSGPMGMARDRSIDPLHRDLRPSTTCRGGVPWSARGVHPGGS